MRWRRSSRPPWWRFEGVDDMSFYRPPVDSRLTAAQTFIVRLSVAPVSFAPPCSLFPA